MGSGAANLLDGVPRGLGALTARLEAALGRPGFRSANPHTPAAVESAVRHAVETGTAEIGDYYELGIGRGYTLWHAQQVSAALGNRTMKFVGFDRFADPEGEVRRLRFQPRRTRQPGLDDVRDMLDRHGTDWSRTILVEESPEHVDGEALGRAHKLRPAAVALLDCRAARASDAALRFLAGRLMNRSLVLLDGADRPCLEAIEGILAESSPWRAEPIFDYAPGGSMFSIRRRTVPMRRVPHRHEPADATA